MLHQPVGDLQRGQSPFASSPQNPQHVVLLHRDAFAFDDGAEAAADHVSGPHQADCRLLTHRAEWLRLLDFPSQGANS